MQVTPQSVPYQPLVLYQGMNFYWPFSYFDAAGTSANWSGYSGVMTVATPDRTTTLISLTSPSNIVFGAGSGALAHTTALSGQVTSITVDSGGTGYDLTPLVYVPPPCGSGQAPVVSATLTAGAVGTISVSVIGTGYTAAPSVLIGAPLAITLPASQTATLTLGSYHYGLALTDGAGNAWPFAQGTLSVEAL